MSSSAPQPLAEAVVGYRGNRTETLRFSKWLSAILVAGAVLRLVEIGRKSFWLDEIASVFIVSKPGLSFWWWVWHDEGNMAMYYVLLRGWLHFGASDTTARLLSVIPGIATILVMYLLGARLFGEKAGLLAAGFMAINACDVMVSQEARAYSFLVLAVAGSTLLLVRWMERPSMAHAVAYALVVGLTFYFHYFGILIPVAHAVSLVALPASRRPWRQMLLVAGILAVLAAPVLWMIHAQNVEHITWVQRPSFLELYHFGSYLAAETGKAVGGVLLAIDLLLIGLFLKSYPRRGSDGEDGLNRWRYAIVVSSFFVPVAISLLVSIVRPVFYHRFLIICLPFWVLMMAVGAEQVKLRRLRTAAIAAVCVLSLVATVQSYTRVKEDWRGAVGYLVAHAQPRDRVLYYDLLSSYGVERYRNWLEGPNSKRPAAITVGPSDNEWEQETEQATRVWLVMYRASPGDPGLASTIQSTLQSHFVAETPVRFRAITVIEYRAKPGT
ncbi:MAG TPA: glycosyltransferase family 39 protein [Terriglobales bacterium]